MTMNAEVELTSSSQRGLILHGKREGVCFNHEEPLLFGHELGAKHACRQAMQAVCFECSQLVDLDQYFRCVHCSTLAQRDLVNQKYTMREMLDEEATRKPLITMELALGRRLIYLGKLLLRILLRPVGQRSRGFVQEAAN